MNVDTSLCDLPVYTCEKFPKEFNVDEDTITEDTLVLKSDDTRDDTSDTADNTMYHVLMLKSQLHEPSINHIHDNSSKNMCTNTSFDDAQCLVNNKFELEFDAQQFLIDNDKEPEKAPEVVDEFHDEECNLDIQGSCILFTLMKIIFSGKGRPPSASGFMFDIRFLVSKSYFGGNISSDFKHSFMTFGLFVDILVCKKIRFKKLNGDLNIFSDILNEKKNKRQFIVFCTLNSDYSHDRNKLIETNPSVEKHCILLKKGNILCPYLGKTKISFVKHVKITKSSYNTKNTSINSYISNIKAVFECVKF
jgi:hypothetical protein